MQKKQYDAPILLLLLAFLGMARFAAAQAMSEQEAAAKAQQILSQLSTGEKIGQLSQLFYFGPKAPAELSPGMPIEDAVAKGDVGSLLFVTDPATINRLQHIAVEQSPHHIPLIFGFDVIHGFRTIFPVPLAMAASWDPAMVTRVQSIAAQEARSVGIDWAFAPMVDIARDPRWGRIVEGAGEDPYLGSAMAAAQVRGFQGDAIGESDHLLATAKHFAGYGAAEGGRDYEASYISDAQLWNIYLQPFHAAVKAGVGTLMSAYMDLNDVPASGNRWLLHDVLRDAWGFQGFVVSDADAVKSLAAHGFAKDEQDAAVRAVTAGVNMEMALGHDAYTKGLPEALKQGLVTERQVDEAVLPILEMKLRMGLFDHPYVDEARSERILADPEHRAAARLAAERSAVLLRNEGSLLPLKQSSLHRVAVIGPLADSKLDTLGSWSFQEKLPETVTVLEGLKNKLGPGADVLYEQGVQIRRKYPSMFDALFGVKPEPEWPASEAKQHLDNAVRAARESDIVVLVLGEAQNMSGERASRESLALPGEEEQLLEAVAAAGKPVVLVMLNGRPLDLRWASAHVPAILEAWYPGTQGGNAIADLLFGDAVPGGKLPITWPRDVGQVPQPYAHNTTQDPEDSGIRYWDEESTPLYPFGYGLSYTTFAFSNLKLDRSAVTPADTVNVSVDVTNTGAVAGDEVVQLYTHQRYGLASRPVRELKGFERVSLKPGETKTVHFALDRDQLAYWSAATHGWTFDPSIYDVWAGDDSRAALHAQFEVQK
ncbi:beta-glucosidase BglX [Silvibacterium dinghuense]|uniref:Periplasmic beta-glucosidase n=1 Tax=Silvibacterium dinghuense TaxID=1560006 RepID=A0A4Q1SJ69_9BACT|nr:beta-glucosidase BglX [Silvibacterium dinghuense]RXS97681.1 beta-glucosidase BglX [Silvibacterium dinghuense]GGH01091.1 beta-glucosidase [Silvibacterium dinghuense]